MIAVIFEAKPATAGREEYLALAKDLHVLLEGVEGFISIERFESLSEPGKLLSLSFWRDEAAVARWRTMREHRLAQAKGRARIFDDYRLRIAAVVRDYGKTARAEAPQDTKGG
jgi:heme-degrading monooxygenase HmoA